MRTVRMIYRQEDDGAWIGTSPEVPGYVAYGDSYEEARDRAREGLPWFAEEDLVIAHVIGTDPPVTAAAAKVSFDIVRTTRTGYRGEVVPSR